MAGSKPSGDAREEAGAEPPVPNQKRPRKHRRVRTEAVEGYDPAPQPEPQRHADDENDQRLRQDKPPHWG